MTKLMPKLPKYVRLSFQVKIESLSEEVRIIRKRVGNLRRKAAKEQTRRLRPLETVPPTVKEPRDLIRSVQYAMGGYTRAQRSGEYHAEFVVKPEIRHTQLAYAFCRNVPYRNVERSCKSKPKDKDVIRIVASLSGRTPNAELTLAVRDWLAM